MNKFMNLPNEVNFILKKLQKYGQGVLVGGAVRDILLGYTPEDFDFATDLEYSKLIEIFSEFSPKEIGKSFGIIQITVNGKFFEIAKFRKDIEIPDCRKKQEIEFTPDLMEDLKRRDFTINAIAWDGKALIYSEKDSLKHIEERALIFVGDPIKRIKEDPLRVLRMIRFICTKKLTPKYILSLKNENSISLKNLSKERIRDEFNKILMSEEVYLGLTLISFL
ncbi:MAG: CCA tRNA nucleotidyltransferase, partial [Fusobacteriaceae bacterium]